jgi:hypothetical protein
MRKLAVSAVDAEPARSTVFAATGLVVVLQSNSVALDFSYEDGSGTPFRNTRAG